MHDAARIMMILDIATSSLLIEFCHKAKQPQGLMGLLTLSSLGGRNPPKWGTFLNNS